MTFRAPDTHHWRNFGTAGLGKRVISTKTDMALKSLVENGNMVRPGLADEWTVPSLARSGSSRRASLKLLIRFREIW